MKKVDINFPVYIEKFRQHEDKKQEILNSINNQQEVEELVGSGNNISRVDWNTKRHDDTREWVQIFGTLLAAHLFKWFENYGYDGFSISEMWFQQYNKGAVHNWHVHGCNFTGIYYLDLPEDSSKTTFLQPGSNVVQEFDVEEGDIIIFPSFVLHKSPENLSDNRKTIISWNFNISVPNELNF